MQKPTERKHDNMKKTTVFILCFVILLSSILLCGCGKTKNETDREKLLAAAFELSGDPNVPKKEAGTYEEKRGKYTVTSTFDADGKLIKQTYSTLSSDRPIYHEYSYDGDKVSSMIRSNGIYGYKETRYFSYDERGKMTERKIVYSGGDPLFERCEYDEEGKIIRISYTYGEDADPLYYGEFVYDEVARKITETEKYRSGEKKSVTERYYDSDWDIIKEEKTSEITGTEYIIEYQKNGQQKRAVRYPDEFSSSRNYMVEEDENGNTVKYTVYSIYGSVEKVFTYEHDEKGRIIKSETYGSDGALVSYSTQEWNDAGYITSGKTYSADGTLKTEIIYSGTSSDYRGGAKIKSLEYYPGGGVRLCTEYNESGYAKKETHYDESGAETGYTIIERNENNHRTGEKQYTPQGVIRHAYEFPGLSIEGTLTETKEMFYDESGNLTFYSLFEYNENNLLAVKKTYSADGTLVSESEYTGGTDRNVIKETQYGYGGAVESITVYGYNEIGKKISQKRYNGSGIIRSAIEFNGTGGEDINTITREEIYSISGELEAVYVYEYNDAGFRIADSEYSPAGIIRTRKEYSGDSLDYWSHMMKCIIYDEEGKKSTTYAYEYSEKGFRKIERIYNSADVLQTVIEYTGETDSYWNSRIREEYYDENGVLDGYIVYERSGDGNDIAREYDGSGVLCVMYEYIGGALYRVTEYNPDGTVKNVETY